MIVWPLFQHGATEARDPDTHCVAVALCYSEANLLQYVRRYEPDAAQTPCGDQALKTVIHPILGRPVRITGITMKNIERLFLWLFLVAAVITFTPIIDLPYAVKARPPKSVCDLNSYLAWRPQTQHVLLIKTRDTDYYLCKGDRARFLASGSAVYCFSSNHIFIGWSQDIGDFQGSLPDEVYSMRYKWTSLDVADVVRKHKELATGDTERR